MNIIQNLNEEQRSAVVNTEGPSLALAGPGSGKTRVLTYRIAYLIENRGVSPSDILAVTFTNKAAKEMKERVGTLLPGLKEYPWVSTFHSFCLRLLRETAGQGLKTVPKNFVVYDDDDSLRLIKAIIKENVLDEQLYRPSVVASKIGMAKSRLEGPDVFATKVDTSFEQVIAQIYSLYQDELQKKAALDFDDLILKAEMTLRTFTSILSRYRSRFAYILVDEFQDTNYAQYNIVKSLAREHRNLFLVGDEDQSIYSWRGANLDNIRLFEEDFPECQLFTLSGNYRCSGNIVQVSSQLISGNRNRIEKVHWTENPEGESVIYYRAHSDINEAEFIAQTIIKITGNYPLRSIAVLYRTNAQSRLIEEKLINYEVPYVVVGGLRFYQRKEIKDIISYYRFIVNPDDDSALERIINVPHRGIGKKTVEQLKAAAKENGLSMGSIITADQKVHIITAQILNKLKSFKELISTLRDRASCLAPSALIKEIVLRTGYLQYLEDDKGEDAESRLDNINQLISAAAVFIKENPEAGIEQYLDHVSLLSEIDEYTPSEKITLMTIHNAKGLEFDAVFLAGLEENLLPHGRSLESEALIEEERRLCFVASTRAAKLLYLTNAKRRSNGESITENKPSRFLDSIDKNLLKSPFVGTESGKPKSPVKNTSPLKVGSNLESIRLFFKDRNYDSSALDSLEPTPGKEDLIKKGTRVRHPVFGDGIIYSVEGSGSNRKARIYFPSEGYKTLMLEYAELEIVGG